MRLITMTWFRRFVGLFSPNQRVGDSILRQIGHGASLDTGRIPQFFSDWHLDLQRYTHTVENIGEMIGTAASNRGFDPAVTLPDDLISGVTVPTLLLWGEDDGFGGPDVAENITSLMPSTVS